MTRIISKFHDYYDSAQSQGADRDRVFVRAQEEFRVQTAEPGTIPAELRAWEAGLRPQMPKAFDLPALGKDYRRLVVRAGAILFAGRLYPFAEVEWDPRIGFTAAKTRFVYEYAELVELLAQNDFVLKKKSQPDFYLAGPKRWSWEEFFGLSGSEQWRAWALDTHRVILSYDAHSQCITVNPCLSKFEFYRKLNAWQAYQELTMFTGTLASPERVPVVVEDKYRVAQYGFDEWSFRKLPSKAHR